MPFVLFVPFVRFVHFVPIVLFVRNVTLFLLTYRNVYDTLSGHRSAGAKMPRGLKERALRGGSRALKEVLSHVLDAPRGL